MTINNSSGADWEDKYQNLIRELGFVELGQYKKDLEKGQFVLFGNIAGTKLILKATPLSDQVKIRGFKKEALIYNIIQTHNQSLGTKRVSTVEVVDCGENKDFFWLTRKYCEGNALADPQAGQYLYGFDDLRPEFAGLSPEIISEILSNLAAFNSISSATVEARLDSESRACKYQKDVENYDIQSIESGLGINLECQINFYNSVKPDYWSKKNIFPCVGDMVPANIIISSGHASIEVLFSDYEWFCLDNKMSDVALLWLFLWKYPEWQRELLKNIITKQEKDFFVASVIRELIGWFSIIFAPNNKPADRNEKAKEFYKNHIWTNYLISAGVSYETLVNTRK